MIHNPILRLLCILTIALAVNIALSMTFFSQLTLGARLLLSLLLGIPIGGIAGVIDVHYAKKKGRRP